MGKSAPELRSLAIEVTNKCNLKCKMCMAHGPWDKGQAKDHPVHIGVDFFKDIVDQFAAFPTKNKTMLPQFQGEPEMHPNFLELCEYINSKGIHFGFTSNGTLMTEKLAKALLKLRCFTSFCFSIDGATKETYEEIRVGAKYEKMLANVRRFLELAKHVSHLSVSVNFVLMPENEHEFYDFIKIWTKEPKICQVSTVNMTDADGWPTKHFWKPPIRNIGCPNIHYFAAVLTNGQVEPCCRDHFYTLNMGNLHEKSLKEIWTGEKYRKLRLVNRTRDFEEYPLCARCDAWMNSAKPRMEEDENFRFFVRPFSKIIKRKGQR